MTRIIKRVHATLPLYTYSRERVRESQQEKEREEDRESATPSLLITVITEMVGLESLVPCAFN